MANVEINDIAAKTTPVDTDELEVQATGGGTSNKMTRANFLKDLGLGNMTQNVQDSWGILYGMCLDSPAVTVASNGTVVTLSVEQSGGGDIRCVFSTGFYDWDCTPADTVTLTAGSDTSPQINYIYFLESNKTLTASTTSFPDAEHVPVATVICQSAASLQTDGAYKMHAWTDHTAGGSEGMGHISHLNHWIRHQHATWMSGVSPTATGGASNFDFATSSGTVLQLHDHAFPAFDTATGSDIYVVNNSSTAYNKVTDLSSETNDADGDALQEWYTVILWGVVNEASADCKMFCNLPTGSYNNNNGNKATLDAESYNVYDIPADFVGVGFLIAAVTVSVSGTTWTIQQTTDLRGKFPGTAAGGGATGGTEFADNVFRIQDNGDTTKQIAFEASGITTGNTRTATMPDHDVKLGMEFITVAASDETTDLEHGTAKTTFRMPYAFTLTAVRASVTTAPTGSALTVDINEGGTSVISTKLTIDATEKTSTTAATPAVISDSALADDAEITIDIDAVGSTIAGAGLKVALIGYRA